MHGDTLHCMINVKYTNKREIGISRRNAALLTRMIVFVISYPHLLHFSHHLGEKGIR